MNKNYSTLVADIGGTNIRLGLIDSKIKTPQSVQSTPIRDFANLSGVIDSYLSDHPPSQLTQISIAVATPVLNDQIKLTNHNWSFNIQEIARRYKLQRIKVINDFTALALSLPLIETSDLQQIGSGLGDPEAAIGLLGAGTGLGVSGLQKTETGWYPVEGEGGHVTIGASDAREFLLFDVLRSRHGHVSAERLLSGPGIQETYQILCEIDGKKAEKLSPGEISQNWKSGSCEVCIEVMELFCHWLGVVAGNLALTLGAKGGFYIGGGIVPKLGDAFIDSSFRESFNNHGCFTDYLSSIPVFIIHADQPALLGAAVALDEKYAGLGIGYQY